MSEEDRHRIRQLGDPWSLAAEEPKSDPAVPASQKPLRYLNASVAAPFFTAMMVERGIPIQWPEAKDPAKDELGKAAHRSNISEAPRPFIPLLSHFRDFCDELKKRNQPGVKRLAWVERTFKAPTDVEQSYFKPAEVPSEAWTHMQYDSGTWTDPDQAPPAGVAGGSGTTKKERPKRVLPWNQKRDGELSGLETLARDGMRLANAALLTFAHLMNGLLDPDQEFSAANRERTLYTLRDLQFCTGEHFCRLSYQLAHLRKINAVNALNLTNPGPFLDTPIGPDLFGGLFKKLHEEDVAKKKAKAAQARLKQKRKGSLPATQSQAPSDRKTSQPSRDQYSDRGQDRKRSGPRHQPSKSGHSSDRQHNTSGGGGKRHGGHKKGGRDGGSGGGFRGHQKQ